MPLEPGAHPITVKLAPIDRSTAPIDGSSNIPNPHGVEGAGATPLLGDFSVHTPPNGRLELLVLQLATADLYQPNGRRLFDEAARLIGHQLPLGRESLVAVLAYRSLTSTISIEDGSEHPVHRILVSVLMELDPVPVSALPALFRLSFLEPNSMAGKASTALLKGGFSVEYKAVEKHWNSWSGLRSQNDKRSFLLELGSLDALPFSGFLFIELAIESGWTGSDESIVEVGAVAINSHADHLLKAHRPLLIAPALALASRYSQGASGLRNMQQGCETLVKAGAAAAGVTSILHNLAEDDGPSALRLTCAQTMLLLNSDGMGDALGVLFDSNPGAVPRDLIVAMVMVKNLVGRLQIGTLPDLQTRVEQFLLHHDRRVVARTADLIAECQMAMDRQTSRNYLRDGTAA